VLKPWELVLQNILPTVKRFARLPHYFCVVVLTSDWESRWPNPGDGAALVSHPLRRTPALPVREPHRGAPPHLRPSLERANTEELRDEFIHRFRSRNASEDGQRI
jgi:hypothetical protein